MTVTNAVHRELHGGSQESLLNWLRAAVLGANDGIVSVAALVVGVAGASDSTMFVITAGVAGLIAGALSMAIGEYVSVSTQKDTVEALLAKERYELEHEPEEELKELTALFVAKGLSQGTAAQAAQELTAHDALAIHADMELHIDPKNVVSPWQAAFASGASFVAGAIIPLTAIAVSPIAYRVPITYVSVLVALVITGMLSAWAGDSESKRATVRVVFGGALAMAITFGIGKLFGVAGL